MHTQKELSDDRCVMNQVGSFFIAVVLLEIKNKECQSCDSRLNMSQQQTRAMQIAKQWKPKEKSLQIQNKVLRDTVIHYWFEQFRFVPSIKPQSRQ